MGSMLAPLNSDRRHVWSGLGLNAREGSLAAREVETSR